MQSEKVDDSWSFREIDLCMDYAFTDDFAKYNVYFAKSYLKNTISQIIIDNLRNLIISNMQGASNCLNKSIYFSAVPADI